jgi:hypothetical protein
MVQPFTGCHSQSTVWEVVPSCGTIIGCISSKATANLPGSQRTTLPWNITLNFFWEELLWLRRNTTLTGVLGDKDVSEQNIAPDAEMSTVLSSKFRSPCAAGLTATMAGRETLRRLYTLDIALSTPVHLSVSDEFPSSFPGPEDNRGCLIRNPAFS